MSASKKVILLGCDPSDDPDKGYGMEFRLTYDGPLYATQRDPVGSQMDPRTNHKHDLRRRFHAQLKRLWQVDPHLSSVPPAQDVLVIGAHVAMLPHNIPELDIRHSLYGFRFVPLVTFNMRVVCSLDILFLRPDRPGGLIWAGDIDNRIKTLFDALRIPVANEQYHLRTPADDEEPFFCLLEDDKLITKVSIETDQLLERVGNSQDNSDTRLVVTVKVRLAEISLDNLHFG